MCQADLSAYWDPRILEAQRQLRATGADVWIVGGAVRDALMGIRPHDYDMAWSGDAEMLTSVVAEGTVIPTGLAHGTATWLFRELPIEVTTFRTDGAYKDHRRPERVQFVRTIEEDLARRDLTVNSMAWQPERGLLDLFGGVRDLEARRIRMVGDPMKRFEEDALRMVRALRFAAWLDSEVEEATAEAIEARSKDLAYVAGERIFHELEAWLQAPAAGRVLSEFREKVRVLWGGSALKRSVRAMDQLPKDPVTRFAWLIDQIEGTGALPQKAARWLARYPMPRDLKQKIERFCETIDALERAKQDGQALERGSWHRACGRLRDRRTMEGLRAWVEVDGGRWSRGDLGILQSLYDTHGKPCATLIWAKEDLPVRGQDLLDLGVAPGPEVGNYLERLWVAYTEGEVGPERDGQLARVEAWLSERA